MEKTELLLIYKNVVVVMASKGRSNWILQRQYFCTTQTGEEVLS